MILYSPSRSLNPAKLIVLQVDVEDSSRMKFTPASSVAVQTLRVAHRVKSNSLEFIHAFPSSFSVALCLEFFTAITFCFCWMRFIR